MIKKQSIKDNLELLKGVSIMNDLFERLYEKVLTRKKELNKFDRYRRYDILDSEIGRKEFFDVSRGLMEPLINQSAIYLNANIFRNILVNKKYTIKHKTIYTLMDFITLTRTMIEVSVNNVVVDPLLCKILMPSRTNAIIIVNGNLTNVSIRVFRGIQSYTRYNSNVSVVLPSDYLNAYIIKTNGVINYVAPVLANGVYTLAINAAGTFTTVLMADSIRMYKITPFTNAQYSYIPFPTGVGFVDLPNIQLFIQGIAGYITPTEHTPLLDGVKVPDSATRILVFYSKNVAKYEDIRHQYDKFGDYMQDFLAGTLPTAISSFTPADPGITPDTLGTDYRAALVDVSKDFANFYRDYIESLCTFQLTTYPILTGGTSLTTKRHPKDMLFFNNGLNISPISVIRNNITGVYTSTFKSTDITVDNIIGIDIGKSIDPYVDYFTVSNTVMQTGPSSNITNEDEIVIYETPRTSVDRLFNELTLYSHTIDKNLININFDPSYIGKNVHVATQKYNRIISKSYSDSALITLPTWASFVSTNNIFTFLNGRLLPRERQYVFNRFLYTILKGDTVLSIDLDTDVVNGETINVLLSSEVEMVDYNVILTATNKIVSLTDKSFPFSLKYNLVFIDGKFIHPADIQIVDTYRFSVKSNSIQNMCILRKKINFEYSPLFYTIMDKWADYLATLTESEIESILGVLNTVTDTENHTRVVYLPERHLFEILYQYCLKDRRELTIEDNAAIVAEIPGVLLPDGRIPISTIRTGAPRYKL
jgi:hypothetical protein